ncbi:MAG: c-type cytochrome biogenesis protein CcmI [Pseudomonadota bacterium]
MAIFWALAAVMTLLALAFVVPPLRRAHTITESEQQHEQVELYHRRLAELEAQDLPPEEFEIARKRMEKELLESTNAQVGKTIAPSARWISIVIAIALPTAALGAYWLSGSPELVNEQAAAHPEMSEQMPASLDEMTATLAARLQEDPENPDGWMLLARSYTTLEQPAKAAEAYSKAIAFGKHEDPEALLGLAESLAFANDGDLSGRPSALIAQARQIAPELPRGMWLGGMAAFQTGEYNTTLELWTKLQAQMDPNSDAWSGIEKYLIEVRQRARGGIAMPPAQHPPPAAAAPDKSEATDAGPQLKVSVTLEASLKDKVATDDTVFIYARAAQGPRMPLAIVSKIVQELPVTVTLTEAMGMMPAMKLSQFEDVVVTARVSPSARATPQPGDLVGESSVVKVTETGEIKVHINSVVGE